MRQLLLISAVSVAFVACGGAGGGTPTPTAISWLPVISGAILWPMLVAGLDTWNRRNR
mgnify:CR=1 FL=1